MSERCVRVVISGQGEQQVQLSVRCPGSDRPVVVQIASLCPPTPARLADAMGVGDVEAPPAPPAVSLELRWTEPPPAPSPPQSRYEPAPLAAAWALAQWLRERQAAAPIPRPRSVRVPAD
jgi:hypothetical protein